MSDVERWKSSMAIPKALSLLTSKHSCEMVDRHVHAMSRIARNNQDGFLLKDLSELCQLLAVCADRLTACPQYEEPLCQLVDLCSRPFVMERSSDESVYAPRVLEVLALLGRLAQGSSDLLRSHTARAVAAFYSTQPDHAHKEGLQVTRVTFNASLVERSAVAMALVPALLLAEEQTVRLELLHALQLLSATPTNCNHMLAAGAARLLCQTLALSSDQQLLFVCVEVLWNLLEHGSQIQVAQQLSSLEAISILKFIFCELMLTASGLHSKQLRNDVLMLCLRIAQHCPDAPFVETGFVRELCVFATFSEESSSSHVHVPDALRGVKLTGGHEDFELRKALLCLLTRLAGDAAAVRVMAGEKLLRSLLAWAVPNDQHTTGPWNPAQFEELQLLALSCVTVLAPLCMEDYMMCQGNTRLLLLLEWCIKEQGDFKGHGNSFHGDGGRGNRLAQLRQTLRLLLSMCSRGEEVVTLDLHEQGGVPLLINLLKHLLESGGGGSPLSEMQADVLLILSCLCETDMHRKELFGGYDGVQLLVGLLQRETGALRSQLALQPSRLLLAAADCVWCTVVGNALVEDIFLESGGVFTLLDLLQVCPGNMQGLLLGVVVDLCENPKAIPHVSSWRGSPSPSAQTSTWALLAQLWRREETEMAVPRAFMATLAGTFQPLMGAEQSACGVPPMPSHCPSAAVLDVSENMRAKIYALCCKMRFQYPSDDLSTEDKVTLCVVENYLEFKSGEVWYEVAGELAGERVRPVTPDRECLTDILHSHEEKAEDTLKQQHELIDEQQRTEEAEEKSFYDKVRQLHEMEERAAREFHSFQQRTSSYRALAAAKRQQLTALDASRKSNVAIGDRFHSLDQHTLNVTTFCGRHVSIPTTPIRLLASAQDPPPSSSVKPTLTN